MPSSAHTMERQCPRELENFSQGGEDLSGNEHLELSEFDRGFQAGIRIEALRREVEEIRRNVEELRAQRSPRSVEVDIPWQTNTRLPRTSVKIRSEAAELATEIGERLGMRQYEVIEQGIARVSQLAEAKARTKMK